MRGFSLLFPAVAAGAAVLNARDDTPPLSRCPGYKASHIVEDGDTLTADLHLAGEPCNIYGKDIEHLTLKVEYETGMCRAIELISSIELSPFKTNKISCKRNKAEDVNIHLSIR